MAASVGIHVGSTNYCVAICKGDTVNIVANDSGDRQTPAVISFHNEDEYVVGLPAKQIYIRSPETTIFNTLQLCARKFDDEITQKFISKSHCKIVNQQGRPVYQMKFENSKNVKVMRPEQILISELKKLYQIARLHTQLKSDSVMLDTVLTVPVCYERSQREALRESAVAAGFNVLRIINEPSAAVLACNIGQTDLSECSNVLLLKVGGSATDVTICAVHTGICRILTNINTIQYSADTFTDILANHLADEFKRKHRADIRSNFRAMAKLKREAENCKHILSTNERTVCSIESLHDGVDFQLNLSRARLESLCQSHIDSCMSLIHTALSQIQLSPTAIHKVILMGGGCRMPKFHEMVRNILPDAEICNYFTSDESAAVGAATQAGILTDKELSCEVIPTDDDCSISVCSTSLISKVLLSDGSETMFTVVPINTPVPFVKQHQFKVSENECSAVLTVYEEPVDDQDEPLLVAVLKLNNLNLKHDTILTATFHMEQNGLLEVSCTDGQSGVFESVKIQAE